MIFKRHLGIALVAVLTVVLASVLFGRVTTTASTAHTVAKAPLAAKNRTVYFATFAIGNRFWAVMEKGARNAARKWGLNVVWTQSQDFSVADTVNRMNTAIAAHPRIMVVTDVDPGSMEPVMRRAQRAGIAVIDVNAQSPSGKPPYLFYVGSNEYLSGRKSADTILAAKPHPGHAACLIQVQGQAALQARCKGFSDVMRAHGVSVDNVDISGGPTQAQEKFRAYMIGHSSTRAVYTLTAGPEAFDPVWGVLRDRHLVGKVKWVTSDLSNSAFQAIRSGALVAAIDQQQYLQGFLPVEWAHLYIDLDMLPANNILTGPVLVNRANVNRVVKLVAAGYR